jgi:hypothetical protein
MDNFQQRPDALTESACLESSQELLALVELFRHKQALIAKQSLARDNALTRFCVHVDHSLAILQAIAGVIDRKATTNSLKRAAELLTGELENLEEGLRCTLHTCLSEPEAED